MKKVLLIDDSKLFREYLANKLTENGFEVIEARNGLEGSLKIRNDLPDLVIMEYYLTRKSSIDILKEKTENPNVRDVPVIVVSSKIDREKILSMASYNVKKFFSKPLKLDSLLQTISAFLQVKVEIDNTPCIIEAHFNDEILFIEIALGLNPEKIELLKFKITELVQLYGVVRPKVLLMMSNIDLKEGDSSKLDLLFNTILEQTGSRQKAVKVLASSDFLRDYIKSKTEFHGIDIKESLDLAMDDLLGLKPDQIAHDEVAAERILTKSAPVKDSQESIELRFEDEKHGVANRVFPEARIAAVDDDIVIQELVKTVLGDTGWEIETYNNGKEFVIDLVSKKFDLVFLSRDGLQLNIPNPFVRTEKTASSSVILKQVNDISRLNTIEFIYKTVFPHDLVSPDTDWKFLAGRLRSGKPLNSSELEQVAVFGIAAEAGIDLQNERYTFAVITARITAGFDISDDSFENTLFITEEENTIRIKMPPVTITDILIEDADSSSYDYPDLEISPEQWKTLTAILSRKLKSEAETRGILRLAEERGRNFIEQLLISAGYSEVIFE